MILIIDYFLNKLEFHKELLKFLFC